MNDQIKTIRKRLDKEFEKKYKYDKNEEVIMYDALLRVFGKENVDIRGFKDRNVYCKIPGCQCIHNHS